MRILAAVALSAILPAQHVTITKTHCTDGQMNGYWTFATGAPGADLVMTSESLSQGYMGTLAVLVLSMGAPTCGPSLASIGLGPACPNVPNDIPGPIMFDPSTVVLLAVVPVYGRMWCNHNLTLPQAALPTVGSIDWTAQYIIYQSPDHGECWQATGNAIRFSAAL